MPPLPLSFRLCSLLFPLLLRAEIRATPMSYKVNTLAGAAVGEKRLRRGSAAFPPAMRLMRRVAAPRCSAGSGWLSAGWRSEERREGKEGCRRGDLGGCREHLK